MSQNTTIEFTEQDIVIEFTNQGATGKTGNGIASITLLSEVYLEKTYRIAMTNGTHFDFVVTDGNSIASIERTSSVGLVDTYTITMTDGVTSYTFTVTNGEKGDKGDAATIAIGTTTALPAGSSATVTNSGDTHDAVFNFGIPKGDKGDKGNLMYATFEIDPDTGILSMFTDDEYNGPTFQLNGAYLEVVI